MIFRSPELGDSTLRALAEVDRVEEQLASAMPAVPRRWFDGLRRLSRARAIQASNRIDGYQASLDDVVAVIRGDDTLDADRETVTALAGYRDASDYVAHLRREGTLTIDEKLIRSLHFVLMRHQLSKNPGRWRPGPAWVRREVDGKILYEGPSEKMVSRLVEEFIASLEADDRPIVVRAAMAHLNIAMIHPFSDGNGRLARCLQTLVLARKPTLAPEFSNIDEWFGTDSGEYFSMLTEVGGGAWNPEQDAGPWVAFCIAGHYRQSRALLRRVSESEKLWDACSTLATRFAIPQRALLSMTDAARGFRVRPVTYRLVVAESEGAEITEQTALRDLKLLVDRRLFVTDDGHLYRAGPELAAAWQKIRSQRRPEPPASCDI